MKKKEMTAFSKGKDFGYSLNSPQSWQWRAFLWKVAFTVTAIFAGVLAVMYFFL